MPMRALPLRIDAHARPDPVSRHRRGAKIRNPAPNSIANTPNVDADWIHRGNLSAYHAMTFGKGRVVVLGEAALFSAQIIRFADGNQQRETKFGMNVPGNDDRQFALNVLHWLSGLLK